MFENFNEEKIWDEYSYMEDIAYAITSLVQEISYLCKRNKELREKSMSTINK